MRPNLTPDRAPLLLQPARILFSSIQIRLLITAGNQLRYLKKLRNFYIGVASKFSEARWLDHFNVRNKITFKSTF